MTDGAPHIPVMLDDVLAALGDAATGYVIDATFGAGGYTNAFLRLGAKVTAFDRDPDAAKTANELAERAGDNFTFHEMPFSMMADVVDAASVDVVVLDVGVSSMQLDQAERGFSFLRDGPLDMRMGQVGPSAADVVNTYSLNDLIRIIGILGEEKNASKIARAIVEARSEAHFETTRTLASIIETASPKRAKDKIHPATRAFQGLRIFVNDELRELARALHAAEHVLKPGGVMAVVSFHSLEDRIVKRFFADAMGRSGGGSRHLPVVDEKPQVFEACGKAMVAAGEDEIARNPRARSAKLRAARRTNAPARMKPDFSIFNLPNLPWIDARGGRQAMHGAV